MKFCYSAKDISSPSTKFAKLSINSDYNTFARHVNINFDKGDILKRHPFLTNYAFEPELVNNAIETFIFKTNIEIHNLTLQKARDYLTMLERKGMYSLKRNKNSYSKSR